MYKVISESVDLIESTRALGTFVHNKYMPNPKAMFAMDLMKHVGIVLGEPDGEDSAGRAKFRLATPEELVARAVAIADLAFATFEDENWLFFLQGSPD